MTVRDRRLRNDQRIIAGHLQQARDVAEMVGNQVDRASGEMSPGRGGQEVRHVAQIVAIAAVHVAAVASRMHLPDPYTVELATSRCLFNDVEESDRFSRSQWYDQRRTGMNVVEQRLGVGVSGSDLTRNHRTIPARLPTRHPKSTVEMSVNTPERRTRPSGLTPVQGR